MCTAIYFKTNHHYFGRNLDLEFSYNETVTITPRNYEFSFRLANPLPTHPALIGMAYVVDDYPLYYDAVNEYGLGMAGLNFPGNAFYQPLVSTECHCVSDLPSPVGYSCASDLQLPPTNTVLSGLTFNVTNTGGDSHTPLHYIAPFEFIPWVLSQCKSTAEAKELLKRTTLVQIDFNTKLPTTPLHFMIADKELCLTVEPTKEGLQVYENPVGVLTNNPPFPLQLFQLNNYMHLSREMPENHFSPGLNLEKYSRGMGALGLPGDLSSQSRFIRAAFVKENSVCTPTEEKSVSQFFHILSSVEQQRGCVHMDGEQYEITVYSSCCNIDKGIYYYTTYDNRQITGIDMHKADLDTKKLLSYPLIKEQQILML